MRMQEVGQSGDPSNGPLVKGNAPSPSGSANTSASSHRCLHTCVLCFFDVLVTNWGLTDRVMFMQTH